MESIESKSSPDGVLVEVVRRKKLDALVGECFVNQPEYIQLSELDPNLALNGVCILPRWTIRKVLNNFEKKAFYERAILKRRSKHLEDVSAKFSGQSFRDILFSLLKAKALVAAHAEKKDPDICCVGMIVAQNEKAIRMKLVSSGGVWIERMKDISIAGLTKIEVETEYLKAFRQALGLRFSI